MHEVFQYAAFGDPVARARAGKTAKKAGKKEEEKTGKEEVKIKTPYSIFNKMEMEGKIVRFSFSFPCLEQQLTRSC